MALMKFIFLGTGLILLMGTAVMPCKSFSAIDGSAEPIRKLQSPESEHKPIVLAQANPQTAESETRTTIKNNEQEPKSGTATTENDNRTQDDSATKPLKPFKPSEEIAAEQAVDFPVDI
jgi:hypothetical protein